MMSKIKTCKNCIHKRGIGNSPSCAKFGYYCSISVQEHTLCSSNFKGFDEKPDSLVIKIIKKIFNV
jgi:hypothetical protein